LKLVNGLDDHLSTQSPSSRKAWIETKSTGFVSAGNESPSSRKAWIETLKQTPSQKQKRSPSSRKAWIETFGPCGAHHVPKVAFLPEGVD